MSPSSGQHEGGWSRSRRRSPNRGDTDSGCGWHARRVVRHPLRSLGPVADRPSLALVPQEVPGSAQGSTHRARTAAKQETAGALRRRRGRLLVSVPLPLKVESDALSATVTALRGSIATGAAIGDADAMLEPVLNAMVARLEGVAQLLGATSRRRGTKRNGAVARVRRPGDVSAAVVAGMRHDFPQRVGSLRRLIDDATNRGKAKTGLTPRGPGPPFTHQATGGI